MPYWGNKVDIIASRFIFVITILAIGLGVGELVNGASSAACDYAYRDNTGHTCYFAGKNAPVSPSNDTLLRQTDSGLPSSVGSYTAFDNNFEGGEVAGTGRSDDVSMVWRGRINFEPGTYKIHTLSDDGVEVWIEGAGVIINNWTDHGPTQNDANNISLNGYRQVQLRWYENGGEALIKFWWEKGGGCDREFPTDKLRACVFNDIVIDENSGQAVGDMNRAFIGQVNAGNPLVHEGLLGENETFTVEWRGRYYFNAGERYRFYTESDDGSWFFLPDEKGWDPVINNGGRHGKQYKEFFYTFPTSGFQRVQINFFEAGGGEYLRAGFDRSVQCDLGSPRDKFEGCFYDGIDLNEDRFVEKFESPMPIRIPPPPEELRPTSGGLFGRNDQFSMRLRGTFNFNGRYHFFTESDDGSRMYVWRVGTNQEMLIDNWGEHGRQRREEVRDLNGDYHVEVVYYENGGDAFLHAGWEKIEETIKPVLPPPPPSGGGCDYAYRDNTGHTCYFAGKNAPVSPSNDTLLRQTDSGLPSSVGSYTAFDNNFEGGEVAGTGRSDDVSMVWRGRINFEPGTYKIHTLSDDGVEVWIEGAGVIINNWTDHGPTQNDANNISLNGYRQVQLRWYENGGEALIKFWWEKGGAPPSLPPSTPPAGPTPPVSGATTIDPIFTVMKEGKSGQVVLQPSPTAGKTVSFQSSNPAIVSVDGAGRLIAHAIGNEPFAVAQISATVDGNPTANFSYALVSRYEGELGVAVGLKTAYAMPFDQIYTVIQKNIMLSAATDAGYDIQGAATGITYPSRNPLWMVAVDPAACGLAGNPMHLGPGCFLLNENVRWGILFHELGHNSTHNSWNEFGTGGVHLALTGGDVPLYQEGNATLIGLYTMQKITATGYGLNAPTLDGMRKIFQNDTQLYTTRLKDYEQSGAVFTENGSPPAMTADALDGIYISFANESSYKWEWVPRFMKAFQWHSDIDRLVLSGGVTAKERATFHAAASTVATGIEIKARFQRWNFPIDDTLYAQLIPIFRYLIDGVPIPPSSTPVTPVPTTPPSEGVSLPRLDLSLSSQSGRAVTINGVVIGDNISPLHWNWGDGKHSYGYFPATHTYAQDGRYIITVTASNAAGSVSKDIEVNVGASPAVSQPVAVSPPTNLNLSLSFQSGRTLTINGAISGAEGSLKWDWGDGTPVTESYFPATHTYAQDGKYTIKVTASNAAGTLSKEITLTIVTTGGVGLMVNQNYALLLSAMKTQFFDAITRKIREFKR